MEYLMLAGVWILNFGISIWNAYSVGKVWVDVNHAGGWPKIVAWAAAVMSALGFTWCYSLIAVLAMSFFGLDPEWIKVFGALSYFILVPGFLLSGVVIMLDSWAQAYRQRTLLSGGVALYNTYAMIHNAYNAIQGFGPALNILGGAFDKLTDDRRDRRDNNAFLLILVVVVVLFCLFGGIITTVAIIRRTAGNVDLEMLKDMARLRQERGQYARQ
jgi:hypothetical protein